MSKKNFDKKKAREQKVKEKLQVQRTVKQQADKVEHDAYLRKKRIKKFKKDMGRLDMWADEVLLKVDDATFTQLEKNAKILKVLEDEYENERNQKGQLNEKLERLGLKTLEEKMKYLHDTMAEEQMNDEELRESLISQVQTEDSLKRFQGKFQEASPTSLPGRMYPYEDLDQSRFVTEKTEQD